MAKSAVSALESLKLNELRPHIVSNVSLQVMRSMKRQQSPTLWISGPPGLGKSEMMVQLCENLGWGLLICYISQMTIDMMSGMPMIKVTGEDDHSKFVPWSIPEMFNMQNMRVKPNPSKFQKIKDDGGPEKVKKELSEEQVKLLEQVIGGQDAHDYGSDYLGNAEGNIPIVLFLDDAHLPDRSIQKYMFQLLGEKTIHKHTLPSNVALILAGNRGEDKAGHQQILAPIANRIRWVDVRYDLDSWVNNYAIKNGIRLDVISFLQNNSECIASTPMESSAWASPRSWTYASLEMDQFEKVNGRLTLEDSYIIVKGTVGASIASRFQEYCALLMQWEADRILAGNRKIVVNRKDAKSKDDIVIGESGDKDGLDRIDCYALMSATVGALIKQLRNVDFKPTKREQDMIEIFKTDVIKNITKRYREIVPLGLRSVLAQEKQHRGSAITRQLLQDNEVVSLISDIIR